MTFILNIKKSDYCTVFDTFTIKYKYCSDDGVVNCSGVVYVNDHDYKIVDSDVSNLTFNGPFNKNKIKYFNGYGSSLDKFGKKEIYKLISESEYVKNTLNKIKEKEKLRVKLEKQEEEKKSAKESINESIDNILFKLNDAQLSYKELKVLLDEKINNHMVEKIL